MRASRSEVGVVVTGLSWSEQQVAEEFAGAVLSMASLCEYLPDRAEAIRVAAVRRLDEQERSLVVALAAQIMEVCGDVHDRG